MSDWIRPPKEAVDYIISEQHLMSEHLITEPPYKELDKPLIINIAPNGATISKYENPNIPQDPEGIIEEVIACYEEGASVWHTHLRVDGIPDHQFENYVKAFDAVAKYAPDLIYSFTPICDFDHMDRHQIKGIVDALMEHKGKQYVELLLMNPISYSCGNFCHCPMTETAFIDQVEYAQELGLKPELQTRTVDWLARVKRFLIEPGILKPPYVLNLTAGAHDSAPTGPNPDGFINMLMLWNQFHQLPEEDTVIAMVAGERNWLPMTTLGISLGVDAVRVGMEEPVYMYPHKNDLITSNREVVRKVKTIAQELGRDIATPAQARERYRLDPPTWL